MWFLQTATSNPDSLLFCIPFLIRELAFRDDNGKPWVLPTVLQAEEIILQKTKTGELNHEYLPISGLPEFVSASMKFALGDGHPALAENRV